MKETKSPLWLFGIFSMIVVVIVAGAMFYGSAAGKRKLAAASFVVISEEAKAGRAIFYGEKEIESYVACIYCHQVDASDARRFALIGPDMTDIARQAETRVPGKSASEYLREAILDPNAHLSKGVPTDVMFTSYEKVLTEEEIDQLVAFLLTLQGGNTVQIHTSE
ncbi:MAG: c-type cytochrome [Chloroflexaceae bacterium]|nr:c-type cytochrome [Chloroflexaceae bacterium]